MHVICKLEVHYFLCKIYRCKPQNLGSPTKTRKEKNEKFRLVLYVLKVSNKREMERWLTTNFFKWYIIYKHPWHKSVRRIQTSGFICITLLKLHHNHNILGHTLLCHSLDGKRKGDSKQQNSIIFTTKVEFKCKCMFNKNPKQSSFCTPSSTTFSSKLSNSIVHKN